MIKELETTIHAGQTEYQIPEDWVKVWIVLIDNQRISFEQVRLYKNGSTIEFIRLVESPQTNANATLLVEVRS